VGVPLPCAGLEKLLLSRRGWGDAELEQLAVTLKEVECPHVAEVDLSANDMTANGIEALGAAVAAGAIHSLETLTLSDCSALLSVPESLCQLSQLRVRMPLIHASISHSYSPP
jgi:hypothetical protein